MSVCIFSTVNQIDAGLVKNALDENNIDNYIKNLNSNSLGLGGWTIPFAGSNLVAGDIEIYVKDEDADKALDIVKALFGENDDNDAGENAVNSDIEEMTFPSSNSNNSKNETIKKAQESSGTCENIKEDENASDCSKMKSAGTEMKRHGFVTFWFV